ncbi:hypothetical protein GBAR_LOCUS20478 [Geodia barretti]|nr:hypothetical protein GBAR_LOCUS20478 [Geodia barretti]
MFVSLTTGNNWDSRLSLNRTNAQVTIEDDDYVTIGLQRTDYTFSSTAEKVEVCVYMSNSSGSQTNCPIGFPVDIFFNFTEAVFEVDSAQELSAGEGIEKVGETALKLQFEMCQSEFCFDISQRNVTREDRGRFEIFLAATPEYGRIIVLDPEKQEAILKFVNSFDDCN